MLVSHSDLPNFLVGVFLSVCNRIEFPLNLHMINVGCHLDYDLLHLKYLSLDVIPAEKSQERVHLSVSLHLLNKHSHLLMHRSDGIMEVAVDRRV